MGVGSSSGATERLSADEARLRDVAQAAVARSAPDGARAIGLLETLVLELKAEARVREHITAASAATSSGGGGASSSSGGRQLLGQASCTVFLVPVPQAVSRWRRNMQWKWTFFCGQWRRMQ